MESHVIYLFPVGLKIGDVFAFLILELMTNNNPWMGNFKKWPEQFLLNKMKGNKWGQTIHIQNMKNFDNPGIFGNASTIPADSISAVNAGIVGFPQYLRQFRQCSWNCRDCRRFAGIAGIVKNFHILANTRSDKISFLPLCHTLGPFLEGTQR